MLTQALTYNSQLLRQQADRNIQSTNPYLEADLLRLAGGWRLFLDGAGAERAGTAYQRLRTALCRVDGWCCIDAEARRLLTGSATPSELKPWLEALRERAWRATETGLAQREVMQILLDDARDLQGLAADLRGGDSSELLALRFRSDLGKAHRRVLQALTQPELTSRDRQARRWLRLHDRQLELLAPLLSEASARCGWYRRRLVSLLDQLVGLRLIGSALNDHTGFGRRLDCHRQCLVRIIDDRQRELRRRAGPLLEHGFPSTSGAAVDREGDADAFDPVPLAVTA